MASQDSYLRHTAGITALLGWLTRWDRFPDAYTQEGASVTLGDFPSRRFALGVPKKRSFGRFPFLALQRDEADWMGSIVWDRAVIQAGSRRLTLVAQRCAGDGSNVPDLPGFSISLNVDLVDKLEILALSPRLEARGLWFEDGESRVANGVPLWSIPLRTVAENEPVMAPDETAAERTFRDLVREQLGRTSRAFNPGFSGEAATLDEEQRKML